MARRKGKILISFLERMQGCPIKPCNEASIPEDLDIEYQAPLIEDLADRFPDLIVGLTGKGAELGYTPGTNQDQTVVERQVKRTSKKLSVGLQLQSSLHLNICEPRSGNVAVGNKLCAAALKQAGSFLEVAAMGWAV